MPQKVLGPVAAEEGPVWLAETGTAERAGELEDGERQAF